MTGRFARLAPLFGCALILGPISFAAAWPVWAEDVLRGRFVKVCKADIERNYPVWSPDQALQLCECRARFLWANHSKSDVGLLVAAAERKELMSLPDPLVKADLAYLKICRKDLSARP